MREQHNTNGKTSQELCPTCHGKGFTVEHWAADDGGPDYVLRPTCEACQGEGTRPAILTRDQAGRARRIQVDGHEIQLDRLDHSDLVLVSCYHGDTGAACEINRAGICTHSLAALLTAARDAGTCITTCAQEEVAVGLAGDLGGKVIHAKSAQTTHGGPGLWIVAGSNGKGGR